MKTEITCTGTKVNFVPVSCAQMQRNNLLYGDGMNYCSEMKVIIDIYVNSPLQMEMLSLVNIFLYHILQKQESKKNKQTFIGQLCKLSH